MCDNRDSKVKCDLLDKLVKVTDERDPLVDKARHVQEFFPDPAEGTSEQ